MTDIVTGWTFETEEEWSDTDAIVIEGMAARARDAGRAASITNGWSNELITQDGEHLTDAQSMSFRRLLRTITWQLVVDAEVAMVFRYPTWCAIGWRPRDAAAEYEALLRRVAKPKT